MFTLIKKLSNSIGEWLFILQLVANVWLAYEIG